MVDANVVLPIPPLPYKQIIGGFIFALDNTLSNTLIFLPHCYALNDAVRLFSHL